MANIPKTSVTLLKNLAADSSHARWAEFVARYRPMMDAYMADRFPFVEAEDVIAETLIALVDVLKNYRYAPNETGKFHNYLTGILRHKALRACDGEKRMRELRDKLGKEPILVKDDLEEAEYRESLFKIALDQFMVDESVAPRTREVFKRVAVKGESPEAVAEAFMMKRHAVDQIKNRSIAKLRQIIKALERADD